MPDTRTARHHALALVVLCGCLLCFSLAGRGLNPDGTFYAQKAKEILTSGDWITMHYNGRPDFQHPPLFSWMQAVAFSVVGVSDSAARFPNALATVLCVLLVYGFGRRLLGEFGGFASAVVLATSWPFLKVSRHALLDNIVALCMLCAVMAAWRGARQNRRWYLLYGVFVGLGLLTKSVLGAFPLLVVPAWLVATRRARQLRDPSFTGGLVVAAAIASIWFAPQLLLHGEDFLEVHLDFLIFGQVAVPAGTFPGWTHHLSYLGHLLELYWPWLAPLPFAWVGLMRAARTGNQERDIALLLLLWVWIPLGLLSLADKQFPRFMMLIFPALSLAVGWGLAGWLRPRWQTRFNRSVWVLVTIALALLILSPSSLRREWNVDVRAIAPVVRARAERGGRLARYRIPFHQINNALLYYADRAAMVALDDPAALAEWLAEEPRGAVVLRTPDYDVLRDDLGADHRMLYRGEEFSYLAAVESP